MLLESFVLRRCGRNIVGRFVVLCHEPVCRALVGTPRQQRCAPRPPGFVGPKATTPNQGDSCVHTGSPSPVPDPELHVLRATHRFDEGIEIRRGGKHRRPIDNATHDVKRRCPLGRRHTR